MNKSTLLVQILHYENIKTVTEQKPIVRLKTRFLRRKKVVSMSLSIWNKQSLNMLRSLKKFDYIIVEGKINKNTKLVNFLSQRQQKDVVFSVSRILKYKSVLKNKDIDLFIK